MRIIYVLLAFLSCTSAYSANDFSKLYKCGVKIESYISGKNNDFVELDIKIEQSDITDKFCPEISTLSVSNILENELMITEVFNNKAGITLQFKMENAINSVLIFTEKLSDTFMLTEDSESNYIIEVSNLIK